MLGAKAVEKRSTGIEIGASAIKVVQVEKAGENLRVTRALIHEIPLLEGEVSEKERMDLVGRELSRLIQKEKLGLGRVASCIPRHVATVRCSPKRTTNAPTRRTRCGR